jgi:hypothetical protein
MNIVVCVDSKTEWNVISCKIVTQQETEILNPTQGGVYMWCGGTVLPTSWVKFFILQECKEVAIAHWGNANEMPVYFSMQYNYTMPKFGRQHKTTTTCDSESKKAEGAALYGIYI